MEQNESTKKQEICASFALGPCALPFLSQRGACEKSAHKQALAIRPYGLHRLATAFPSSNGEKAPRPTCRAPGTFESALGRSEKTVMKTRSFGERAFKRTSHRMKLAPLAQGEPKKLGRRPNRPFLPPQRLISPIARAQRCLQRTSNDSAQKTPLEERRFLRDSPSDRRRIFQSRTKACVAC